jgi:hypothetical protein
MPISNDLNDLIALISGFGWIGAYLLFGAWDLALILDRLRRILWQKQGFPSSIEKAFPEHRGITMRKASG